MKKHGLMDISLNYAATPGDRETRRQRPRSTKVGDRP